MPKTNPKNRNRASVLIHSAKSIQLLEPTSPGNPKTNPKNRNRAFEALAWGHPILRPDTMENKCPVIRRANPGGHHILRPHTMENK
eukprot:6483118-Amphidinium_carterae.1